MNDKISVLNTSDSSNPTALRERFAQLAAQWREETKFLSSSTQIAMHPAYQQIIGMGPAVLPLIFRELEREPYHWYWALKCITGIDPVPPGDKGQRPKMRQAWLQWAEEQGYQ